MQHEHSEQFETFTNQYISQSFAASLTLGLEQDFAGTIAGLSTALSMQQCQLIVRDKTLYVQSTDQQQLAYLGPIGETPQPTEPQAQELLELIEWSTPETVLEEQPTPVLTVRRRRRRHVLSKRGEFEILQEHTPPDVATIEVDVATSTADISRINPLHLVQVFTLAERLEGYARLKKYQSAYLIYVHYLHVRQQQLASGEGTLSQATYAIQVASNASMANKLAYVLRQGQKIYQIVQHFRDIRVLNAAVLYSMDISAVQWREVKAIFPVD
ncbi:hypothetical protein G6F68_009731 [Rhizopus microsporus]|nr:hypothetical protein G6F69_009267 [Rhizopus microsporus]KAG1225639.1 hypothetical protein G6F67_009247 [Rhizopus microsporus]KAG1256550.1 hypothetical protein G6F68_009731 [Rhizopus microsporus]